MISQGESLPVDEVRQAAQRGDVVAAMREFYADADRAIAAQPGTCWNRGACCRFGQFGHRLYVTSLEVSYYLATGDGPPPVTEDACPHAYAGQCHVRDRRPLGCRVFYCDPAAQGWQGPLTEESLARLRQLHGELTVPYAYAEWLRWLRAVGNGCGDLSLSCW